jgi:iron complex outermembrane receptor protein
VISPPFLAGDPLGFLPEFVDNYEIGLKTFWFDRALGVNIAAFMLDWQDKQEQIFTGTSFLIRNAATAQSEGVELEVIARPTRSLMLDANIAYLNAHYENFPTNPPAEGKTFPGLPEYSGSLGVQWTQPIEPGAQFIVRGDVVYTGQSYTDTTNTLTSGEVTTFNGRIGVESDDERWGLYAWGRNLTDEVRLGGGQTFPFPNSTIVTRGAGLGRTYGLELRARY